MILKEMYQSDNIQHNGFFEWTKPIISYEIFPPKPEHEQDLYVELEKLKKYSPALVSLTCNAGGIINNTSTEHSTSILKKIKNDLQIDVMPHFTCICNKEENVESNLKIIEELGIQNILALRGDEPKDIDVCHLDFRYADELVSFIKAKTSLSIAVAGYPEGHLDAPDLFTDIKNLRQKVDAGADVIYTQLFFDNTKFFDFIQLTRDEGIDVPIIPGIMPIISYKQIEKMTSMTKVDLPDSLKTQLEKYKESPSDIKKIGVDFASYQCQQLIDFGVKGLHFFTLNKADSTSQIIENIL